jgi:hypothetical protein
MRTTAPRRPFSPDTTPDSSVTVVVLAATLVVVVLAEGVVVVVSSDAPPHAATIKAMTKRMTVERRITDPIPHSS